MIHRTCVLLFCEIIFNVLQGLNLQVLVQCYIIHQENTELYKKANFMHRENMDLQKKVLILLNSSESMVSFRKTSEASLFISDIFEYSLLLVLYANHRIMDHRSMDQGGRMAQLVGVQQYHMCLISPKIHVFQLTWSYASLSSQQMGDNQELPNQGKFFFFPSRYCFQTPFVLQLTPSYLTD